MEVEHQLPRFSRNASRISEEISGLSSGLKDSPRSTTDTSKDTNASRRTSAFYPSRQYHEGALPPSGDVSSASVLAFRKAHQGDPTPEQEEETVTNIEDVPIVFQWDIHSTAHLLMEDTKPSRNNTTVEFALGNGDDEEVEVSKMMNALASRRKSRKSAAKESTVDISEDDRRKSANRQIARFREESSRAQLFFNSHQYRRAVQSLSKALEIRPKDLSCYLTRSKCFLEMGMANEALRDAESAIAYNGSSFPQALLLKAEALYRLGRFEMALVFFHRGRQVKPEMNEFQIGIHKAEEAIINSLGQPGDIKDRSKSAFVKTKPQKTLLKSQPRSKSSFPGKRTKHLEFEETQLDIFSKESGLLGELERDKTFLGNLLKEEGLIVIFI